MTAEAGHFPNRVYVSQAGDLHLFDASENAITDLSSATELVAGASGTAGDILVYPATAASGKTKFTAADNSGDTTTEITTAAQSGSRIYTVPDAGASTSFVMLVGAQSLSSKTLVSPVISTGLTASGSAANDFSGSTGTFKTSTGTNTLGGNTIFKLIATPVAAAGAGGGVAGAAALGAGNFLTVSSDGATKGVKLLTGAAGDVKWILNTSGTACNLFAASGGTINGGAGDAGCTIPASKGVLAVCTAADTWTVFDLTAHAGAAA